MRRSELLSLRWEDVDLENGDAHSNAKTVQLKDERRT